MVARAPGGMPFGRVSEQPGTPLPAACDVSTASGFCWEVNDARRSGRSHPRDGEPGPGFLRAKSRCLNFYDPDDILGYSLKSISEGYAEVVARDIAINAGGMFSSWNPLSHNGYWSDNDFTQPVAHFISSFL